jgi:hypothetical protein
MNLLRKLISKVAAVVVAALAAVAAAVVDSIQPLCSAGKTPTATASWLARN